MKKNLFWVAAAIALAVTSLGCPSGDDDEPNGPSGAKYTVTFDPNGGALASSKDATRKVTGGAAVGALPGDPAKSGAYFAGWYTQIGNDDNDNNWGSAVSAETIILKDITFYAKWSDQEVTKVTITFDAQGGTVTPAARQVAAGEKAGDLPLPEKAGSMFRNWYLKVYDDAGVEQEGAETTFTKDSVVQEDITVYAKWLEAPASLLTIAKNIKASSHGYTPDDPVEVVIPSTVTVKDVETQYPNPSDTDITITDGLGALYAVFGGKYVSLDLTKISWYEENEAGDEWKAIPSLLNSAGLALRPDRDKIVALKLPSDLEYIGSYAFAYLTNLKAIDFSGLSKLKEIGPYSFRNCTAVESVSFEGCTSLTTIWNHAFIWSLSKIKVIDLTPCTSLTTVQRSSLRFTEYTEAIEFPASLNNMGDYAIEDMYNLKYIRFRSLLQPEWGWSVGWYHDWADPSYSGGTRGPDYNPALTSLHFAQGVEGGMVHKTDHQFAIYHPNTIAWTKPHGGYYMEDFYGWHMVGANVPEGDPIGPGGTAASVPVGPSTTDKFWGQAQVTIEATGLPSEANGKTVTTNVDGTSAAISGGSVTLTLGTPTKDLQVLTNEAAEELTGAYTPIASEHWGGSADPSYGGNEGYLGEPWVSDRTGSTQFAILDLSVGDSQKLVRKASGSLVYDQWNQLDSEDRLIRYVYVSKDVVITKESRDGEGPDEGATVRTVCLTLKQGWNLVERCTRTWNVDKTTASKSIALYITGGITPDDGDTLTSSTRDSLKYKPIGWVIE